MAEETRFSPSRIMGEKSDWGFRFAPGGPPPSTKGCQNHVFSSRAGVDAIKNNRPTHQNFSELQVPLLKAVINHWYKFLKDDDNCRGADHPMFQLFVEEQYHRNKLFLSQDFKLTVRDISANHVTAFILSVLHGGGFDVTDIIMSMFYVSRFKRKSKIVLHAKVWRPLFVTALLVADKVCQDRPVKNSDVSKLFPVLSNGELKQLEDQFVRTVDWEFNVEPDDFTQFCETLLKDEQVNADIERLVDESDFTKTLQLDRSLNKGGEGSLHEDHVINGYGYVIDPFYYANGNGVCVNGLSGDRSHSGKSPRLASQDPDSRASESRGIRLDAQGNNQVYPPGQWAPMTFAGNRESGYTYRPPERTSQPERTSHSMGSLGNKNPPASTMDRCHQWRGSSPAGTAPPPRSTAPAFSGGPGSNSSRMHSASSRPMGMMGSRPPMNSGGMNAGLSMSGGGYSGFRSPQKGVNSPQATASGERAASSPAGAGSPKGREPVQPAHITGLQATTSGVRVASSPANAGSPPSAAKRSAYSPRLEKTPTKVPMASHGNLSNSNGSAASGAMLGSQSMAKSAFQAKEQTFAKPATPTPSYDSRINTPPNFTPTMTKPNNYQTRDLCAKPDLRQLRQPADQSTTQADPRGIRGRAEGVCRAEGGKRVESEPAPSVNKWKPQLLQARANAPVGSSGFKQPQQPGASLHAPEHSSQQPPLTTSRSQASAGVSTAPHVTGAQPQRPRATFPAPASKLSPQKPGVVPAPVGNAAQRQTGGSAPSQTNSQLHGVGAGMSSARSPNNPFPMSINTARGRSSSPAWVTDPHKLPTTSRPKAFP